ncbi:ABC transporter ATP-binding protein [Amycolatopsis cihanbeyliensis]|uniref:Amino acid/amide ABC transporter ATP-binding protein 2 (HAAT family) n=1 Tax=Amycolatopsis cihanbeyliensis TaxID=1128664 RepID=A0A542CSG3_AMYCI|nr:ABC transporter ATP-binding protein [Amycolatopsis cihanbeyliensis]TQI93772.1 amino acid/amide ABC transporter ATP-binding protein 2 (HAAT family) [Amycolatopsis cihanbeyliensis]
MNLLEVEDVTIERSGLPVVRGVSLTVAEGKISVVLGANGAGKTSLLEGISGAVRVSSGQVRLAGQRIEKARPWRRARAGVAHVEQNRTVFRDLSVVDNLRAGCRRDASIEEAFELFPELGKQRSVAAGLLSGGEQQMLVLGRALLGRPKVLLIDEMSLGLAPMVIERLARAVGELAGTGVGVLLVEQFAALALSVADHAYVLARGEVVFQGERAELLDDEELLRALYLGDPTRSQV